MPARADQQRLLYWLKHNNNYGFSNRYYPRNGYSGNTCQLCDDDYAIRWLKHNNNYGFSNRYYPRNGYSGNTCQLCDDDYAIRWLKHNDNYSFANRYHPRNCYSGNTCQLCDDDYTRYGYSGSAGQLRDYDQPIFGKQYNYYDRCTVRHSTRYRHSGSAGQLRDYDQPIFGKQYNYAGNLYNNNGSIFGKQYEHYDGGTLRHHTGHCNSGSAGNLYNNNGPILGKQYEHYDGGTLRHHTGHCNSGGAGNLYNNNGPILGEQYNHHDGVAKWHNSRHCYRGNPSYLYNHDSTIFGQLYYDNNRTPYRNDARDDTWDRDSGGTSYLHHNNGPILGQQYEHYDGISGRDDAGGTKQGTVIVESPLPKATCGSNGYLIQAQTLYYVDIINGNSSIAPTRPVGDGVRNINAIGYNSLDNYIYGSIGANPSYLIRISSTGDSNILQNLNYALQLTCGDVDNNGQYYASNNGITWIQVDLRPGSATYGQTVNSGNSSNTIGPYTVNDWGYVPTGGTKLWGLGYFASLQNSTTLLSWDTTTHSWTVGANFGNVAGKNTWGAVYASSDGGLYGSENFSGKIYRFPLDGTATAQFVANGPNTTSNDGARCVT
ncbi:hypothetical protein F4780DRAFT_774213 [Xylariomycetidae sp. FL0641]|nr:hypothetical protein F4780DRAFT_774213 [Xylariomycetidae sp. FL0641]